MDLPERRSTILTFIVEDYISTVTPVASTAIAVESGLGISSATIRSEMGVLREEGYLIRPHTSSGAVPSEKAYRHFVDRLDLGSDPPSNLVSTLHEHMGFGVEDVDAWVQIASMVISDLIGALAFITAPRSKNHFIKGIELLRMQDMLIMLVLIMQEARIYKHIIELEEHVTDSQLEQARNLVNAKVSGKELQNVLADEESTATQDDFQRQIWDATISILQQDKQALGERYMNGFYHFISEPEMTADPESGALALSALESDDIFTTLVSGVSEQQQPVIYIGSDNPHHELHDFSVIMCGYGQNSEVQGVVGLMSPIRTAYDRAIPAVNFTAETLNSLLNRNVNL